MDCKENQNVDPDAIYWDFNLQILNRFYYFLNMEVQLNKIYK